VYLLTAPETTAIDSPLELTLEDLVRLYAVDETVPCVRANLVTSLDGRVSGADGLSASLSTTSDRTIFHLLRSLSDAIVVGAGTVRAENYRLPVVDERFAHMRAEQGRENPPVLVVVSHSCAFEQNILAIQSPTIVITDSTADRNAIQALSQRVEVIQLPGQEISLHQVVDLLRERGLNQILTEGGAQLLAQCLKQQVLDELCLTLSPTLVGSISPSLISGQDLESTFEISHVLADADTVMVRYLLSQN
jgi:5-amino-6-(5-phosphoribosylamino)uracil reductase